ncbi:hypothetical protein [Pseudoduganella buxea]|uniref:Uncharacterized protein n=1 Tax=Pseudoduganella buxea TaxID=1949069 RepID=A0A6I3T0J0_9BURK|nr:hypothetical protein [Pseudoduganella buxea]MTV54933.1 hypothetical protein [Pseudoduganella buxea]GGC23694.1 hypothetical protein GCM10011572_51530 [Pseudoduganella buxea]
MSHFILAAKNEDGSYEILSGFWRVKESLRLWGSAEILDSETWAFITVHEVAGKLITAPESTNETRAEKSP